MKVPLSANPVNTEPPEPGAAAGRRDAAVPDLVRDPPTTDNPHLGGTARPVPSSQRLEAADEPGGSIVAGVPAQPVGWRGAAAALPAPSSAAAAAVVAGRTHRSGRRHPPAAGSHLPAASARRRRRYQLPRTAYRHRHPLGLAVHSQRALPVRAGAAPAVRAHRVGGQPRLVPGHDRGRLAAARLSVLPGRAGPLPDRGRMESRAPWPARAARRHARARPGDHDRDAAADRGTAPTAAITPARTCSW